MSTSTIAIFANLKFYIFFRSEKKKTLTSVMEIAHFTETLPPAYQTARPLLQKESNIQED
jgi:hypothetical protein